MNELEIWKEYTLNYENSTGIKIYVSNYGRLKSVNKLNPEGYIIKGSMINGYLIYRTKLTRYRTQEDLKKIEKFQEKIDSLNATIKQEKSKIVLIELRTLRDDLIKKRKKIILKIDKKNYINIGVLFHKAVAELFLEKPKDKNKKFIIHKDFDKLNNHVDNLAWSSREELAKRSSQHPKVILHHFNMKTTQRNFVDSKAAKLNEENVRYIKQRLKKGDTLKKLAHQFRVSDMQIHRIKIGECWKNVKLVEELKLESIK